MHVSQVELVNIKSHTQSQFNFEKGITALIGENGAGKTTILEAIAWVLFDYMDYNKDDFVKRGAKKGSARVTFESDLDQRPYIVYRDTGQGYYVFDPGLNMKIAEQKTDVGAFLRQHLGIEPGTDLKALFKSAIGVPQGTFTSDFLLTAVPRMEIFNKLLKVEEYREGADKLLSTVRLIEERLATVREGIASAVGRLLQYDPLVIEHGELLTRIKTLDTDRISMEESIASVAKVVEGMDTAAQRIMNAKAAKDRLEVLDTGKKREVASAKSEVDKAQLAATRQEELVDDHTTHLNALDSIQRLEKDRATRDELRAKATEADNDIKLARRDLSQYQDELAKAEQADSNATALAPEITKQEKLESDRNSVRDKRAQAISTRDEVAPKLDREITALKVRYRTVKGRIDGMKEATQDAGDVDTLATRESELAGQLAEIRAGISRDEKFHKEVQNGLCPILSQRCLNIGEDQNLEDYFKEQLESNTTQVVTIKADYDQVVIDVAAARAAATRRAEITLLEQQLAEIEDEGKTKRAEHDAAVLVVNSIPALEEEITALDQQVTAMADPRGRAVALRTEAAKVDSIKGNIQESNIAIKDLETSAAELAEKLKQYSLDDEQWEKARSDRDRTAEAHREYIGNEALVATLPTRKAELDQATGEAAQAAADLTLAGTEYDVAIAAYQQDEHELKKTQLAELRNDHAGLKARLEVARERESAVDMEINHLNTVRESMSGELRAKEKLEALCAATEFIRDTLRQAGPLIAESYQYNISIEANLLFREISGQADCTLRWSRDYDIILEEEGQERPFKLLSGGEQMGAAMAIRLAILKQLSDIRLAFFDEPTTNMDRERRAQLAQQIGQVRNFDQLFVISHDDTFEDNVDHVVHVKAGETMTLSPTRRGSKQQILREGTVNA